MKDLFITIEELEKRGNDDKGRKLEEATKELQNLVFRSLKKLEKFLSSSDHFKSVFSGRGQETIKCQKGWQGKAEPLLSEAIRSQPGPGCQGQLGEERSGWLRLGGRGGFWESSKHTEQ